MPTGVLVHGLHVNSQDWTERAALGIPPYMPGRAAHAIALLLQYPQANRMLFGSGASMKDGMLEGAYTIAYMLEHFDELRKFPAFGNLGVDAFAQLRTRFARIAESLDEPKDTFQEAFYGIPRLYQAGAKHIIVVSDPPAIARCLAHALDIRERRGFWSLQVTAEHSLYQNVMQSACDVVVVEPLLDGTNYIGTATKQLLKVPSEKQAECMGVVARAVYPYISSR